MEEGHRFHRDLPDFRLVVIPVCGRVPREEYPEENARLIVDFNRETAVPVE